MKLSVHSKKQKTVDTSDVSVDKKPPGKRTLLAGGVLLIVLLGLGLILKTSMGNQNAQLPTFNETVTQSDNLVANRNYDEALSLWDSFLEFQPSPEEQGRAHLEIARIYVNKNQDFASALDHYKIAESLAEQPDYGLITGIIAVSQQTNDKVTELEYSKKAIEALDKNDPLYAADKAAYEKRIDELNAELN